MAQKYPVTRFTRHATDWSWKAYRSNGATNSGKVHFESVDQVTLGESPADWRRIIANGGSATSSLSGTKKRVISNMYGNGLSINASTLPPLVSIFEGCTKDPTSYFPAGSSVNELKALDGARSKLLGSYLDARNNWRGGNFLVEVGETIKMLRHPIKSLFGDTVHFVRGVHKIRKVKDKETYRKRLGNLWLAYSFGWKPLFEDIKDANKAIMALAEKHRSDSIPIEGSGVAESVLRNEIAQYGTFVFMQGSYDWLKFEKARSNAHYHGAIHARPEKLSTVAESFGVDPWDVIPAVWEAIPWSFLVDYFLNVQEKLDAMRYASADLSWLELGTKNVHTVINNGWQLRTPLPAKVTEIVAVAPIILETTDVNRSRVNSMPYPRFHFKIPKLGSLKWVNVAALISQISASRPPR